MEEEWSDPALDAVVAAMNPALPARTPRPPTGCQCTATTGCGCLPCPNELDQEDLLCPACRDHKKSGRMVGHCHRTMARLKLAAASRR